MMRISTIAMCTVMLAALPAVAGPVAGQVPSGIMLMRDSDGIVISVVHPPIYFALPTGLEPGGIYYTFRGQVLDFSAGVGSPTTVGVTTASLTGTNAGSGTGGPTAATAQIGGVTYQVETDAKGVWLVDPVSKRRFSAERRVANVAPDAIGHKVNPKAFALD